MGGEVGMWDLRPDITIFPVFKTLKSVLCGKDLGWFGMSLFKSIWRGWPMEHCSEAISVTSKSSLSLYPQNVVLKT